MVVLHRLYLDFFGHLAKISFVITGAIYFFPAAAKWFLHAYCVNDTYQGHLQLGIDIVHTLDYSDLK